MQNYNKHGCEKYMNDFYLKYENFLYFCTIKIGGTIAQSVEQRTENPCVPGSIPGGTTDKTHF